MFVRVVDSCQPPVLNFIYFSVGVPISNIIPIEYLLASPTSFVSYHGVRDLGGVGAARCDGIGDGPVL